MALHSGLARGLFRRAGLRLFRFFARPLEAAPSAPTGFDIHALRPADLAALGRDSALDLREEFIAAAQSRGDFCLGAYEGDRLAGYCWFAFAPLPHLDGVWVRFGSDIAWVYKSFVRSAYRGRGVAARLYRFPDPACAQRGRSVSLICVESNNAASIRAALRAGYEDAGRAWYLRRGQTLARGRSASVKEKGVEFFLAP